jgi:Rrf2 family cysteine metabolism transcriptional repressor
MLRVSSRGRYGVKAVFELALRYGDGPISLSLIAREQGLTEPYLEQLMPSLKRAGLVESARGSQGGYRLSRHPSRISVGDVVRALEGPIMLTTCTSEDPHDCPELSRCIGPDVWSRVQQALVATMDSMTFDGLLAQKEPALSEALVWQGSGGST